MRYTLDTNILINMVNRYPKDLFTLHMDPSFVDGAPDDEKDFERWLEEDIQ